MAVSFFTGLIGGYNRRKAEERASDFEIEKLETAGAIERGTRESVAGITGQFTLDKQEMADIASGKRTEAEIIAAKQKQILIGRQKLYQTRVQESLEKEQILEKQTAADIAAGERKELELEAAKEKQILIGRQKLYQTRVQEAAEAESALDVQESRNIAADERNKRDNKVKLEDKFIGEFFDFHEGNTIYGATPFDSVPDFGDPNWLDKFLEATEGEKKDKDFIKVKNYDDKNPGGFLFDILGQYNLNPQKFINLKENDNNAYISMVNDWGKALYKAYQDDKLQDTAGTVVSLPAFDRIFEPLIAAFPEFNDAYLQVTGQARADAANMYNEKNQGLDNQATNVVEENVEVPLEDGDTAMTKTFTAYKFDATDFGFPDNTDASQQQIQKALTLISENDPQKRTVTELQNEFYKGIKGQGGTNFHPAMIKAVLLAEPYMDKNTLSPLPQASEALEKYFESNNFYRGNIGAQYELFKLVTGDNKNHPSALGMRTTLVERPDKTVVTEAKTRFNAAREADRLTNMYLELLSFQEGRGDPTVPVVRNLLQKFEGIKDTFTQTLGLLTTMSQREGGQFALGLRNELEGLYGEDGASLWKMDEKNPNLLSAGSVAAMLDFVEVALAYQTSMAFQGGSGGRTVSNEDYKLVLRAIRGYGVSSPDHQRARMVQLQGFLEAPMVISRAIVQDGIKGVIAAEKFGDFYYDSKNIQLAFGDKSMRGESVSSNIQVFEQELNMNPRDGVTNNFYLDPSVNWKKEKRSRIQVVVLGDKKYAGFIVWNKSTGNPDRFVAIPKTNPYLNMPNMLFNKDKAYPPEMAEGIINQLSDEMPSPEELRELFDTYRMDNNYKPQYQAPKEKSIFSKLPFVD